MVVNDETLSQHLYFLHINLCEINVPILRNVTNVYFCLKILFFFYLIQLNDSKILFIFIFQIFD